MDVGRVSKIVVFGLLAVGSLLGIIGVLGAVPLALLMILSAAGIGYMINAERQQVVSDQKRYSEREATASRLRTARERERAFYELASTLSATLDHHRVLEIAQDIGALAASEYDQHQQRIVSAALLFRGARSSASELYVAHHRGLTRPDQQLVTRGSSGVIGLALQEGQTEPVFASMPQRDPELQYYAAFQDCRSMLAMPLRAGFDLYGVLIFGSTQPDAFSPDYVDLLKATSTLATIALQNAVLYQNLLSEKERIVEVEEDARKKLARDLHDGPTQSVAAIAMRINYIRRLIGQQVPQAFEELGKVEDLSRRTTKEIRHMLFTLRPLVLETQGLTAALQQLAEKMRDMHNSNVIVEAQPGVERWLDHNAQGVCFYIVEEAVNNASKYAQAEHIWVRLRKQDELFLVEIQDDGVGFDVERMMESARQRNSLGMLNMQDRAELVEGRMHINSTIGEGTLIQILVPIRAGSVLENPEPQQEPEKPLLTRLAKVTAPEAVAPTSNNGTPRTDSKIKRIEKRVESPNGEKPNIPFASKQSPSS